MVLRITRLDTRLHQRAAFQSGESSLDAYLHRQAGQHQRAGIATTHVLFDQNAPAHVLGYCSLAAAQADLDDLQAADRKHMPAYPVPAVRMARLAVAREAQGNGYGRLLLGHAMNVGVRMRSELGVRIILVDALHERAAAFYRLHGFRETAGNARTLYLPLGKG